MSSILFRVSPLNYYINLSVFSDQVISVSVNFSLLDLVDFTVTLLFLLPEGVLDLNLKTFVWRSLKTNDLKSKYIDLWNHFKRCWCILNCFIWWIILKYTWIFLLQTHLIPIDLSFVLLLKTWMLMIDYRKI